MHKFRVLRGGKPLSGAGEDRGLGKETPASEKRGVFPQKVFLKHA